MADIEYRFRETGADDMIRTFDTITKSAKESARAARAARESRSAPRGGQQDAHVRAFHRERQTEARYEAQRMRMDRAALAARVRETTKAAKAEAKAKIDALLAVQRAEKKEETRQRQAMAARRQHASRVGASVAGSIAGAAAMKGFNLAQTGADAMLAIGSRAVTQGMNRRDMARALAVSARGAGQQLVSPDALLGEAQGVEQSTKVKAEDVLTAQQRYVSMTGDLDSARKLSTTFAHGAMASGAKAEDIAATAATLSQKFGIKSPEDMQRALGSLIQQGKSGAFEMRDMSAYVQEMGAAGSRFGLGEGAAGVSRLGALSQIARQSTGSGAEASTAVQSMLSDLVDKSGKIKKLTGTDVFTDKSHTKTRNVEDVLAGVIKGAKGDQVKLSGIFGERGIRGMSSLIEAFNKGSKSVGKNATEAERMAAGEAAVRKMFSDLQNAGGSWGEVLKDSATMSQSASAQIDAAWGSVVATLEKSAGPGLEKLAATLSSHSGTLESVLTPVADAFGTVLDSVDAFVSFLASKGFISKTAPAEETPPQQRKGQIAARLGELDQLEKGPGLTSEQKAERRKLLDERVKVQQRLGDVTSNPELDFLNFDPGSGPPPGTRTFGGSAVAGPAAAGLESGLWGALRGSLGVGQAQTASWGQLATFTAGAVGGRFTTGAVQGVADKIDTDATNAALTKLTQTADAAANALKVLGPRMPGLPSILGG